MKLVEDNGVAGYENISGNGTYRARNKTVRRYVCHSCGKRFMIVQILSIITFTKMNLPLISPKDPPRNNLERVLIFLYHPLDVFMRANLLIIIWIIAAYMNA